MVSSSFDEQRLSRFCGGRVTVIPRTNMHSQHQSWSTSKPGSQTSSVASHYSIDVECVATGSDHNSRSVAQVAVVVRIAACAVAVRHDDVIEARRASAGRVRKCRPERVRPLISPACLCCISDAMMSDVGVSPACQTQERRLWSVLSCLLQVCKAREACSIIPYSTHRVRRAL